ncbi:hypothetical protein F53441_6708 [Fusarium austroafricanum]|uniref:Uncharacterized protein n=1 Tax=Fusarium austroafricanum TaxID=2364996 RepID=A0A8H4KI43_9HYPO|nr:hypothetical protein F53441_6708 [Fusarium austroafricanum]
MSSVAPHQGSAFGAGSYPAETRPAEPEGMSRGRADAYVSDNVFARMQTGGANAGNTGGQTHEQNTADLDADMARDFARLRQSA